MISNEELIIYKKLQIEISNKGQTHSTWLRYYKHSYKIYWLRNRQYFFFVDSYYIVIKYFK